TQVIRRRSTTHPGKEGAAPRLPCLARMLLPAATDSIAHRDRHLTEKIGIMATFPKPRAYRFTFGPWNISTGSDPFGPPVRNEVAFATKVREYKKLGFDGVQLHDDDAVEQIDRTPAEVQKQAARTKKLLDAEGL